VTIACGMHVPAVQTTGLGATWCLSLALFLVPLLPVSSSSSFSLPLIPSPPLLSHTRGPTLVSALLAPAFFSLSTITNAPILEDKHTLQQWFKSSLSLSRSLWSQPRMPTLLPGERVSPSQTLLCPTRSRCTRSLLDAKASQRVESPQSLPRPWMSSFAAPLAIFFVLAFHSPSLIRCAAAGSVDGNMLLAHHRIRVWTRPSCTHSLSTCAVRCKRLV